MIEPGSSDGDDGQRERETWLREVRGSGKGGKIRYGRRQERIPEGQEHEWKYAVVGLWGAEETSRMS